MRATPVPAEGLKNIKDQLKIPPHSVEAEQAVLGGLMLDANNWDKVADRVYEQDFYRREHQVIFNAVAALIKRQQPLDVLTVAEQLKTHNQLEAAGGEVKLYELAKNTPSAANIVAYADIVKERAILRKLITIAGNVLDTAFNPEGLSSQEVLDQAEQQVFKIAEQHQRNQGPVHVDNILATAVERLDNLYRSGKSITGLETGFKDLDNLTTGFQPADLVIVAGRPSMGKTTLALNMAEHAVLKSDKPVLVFSLEMPGHSLITRMLASLGRIDLQRLRTGKLTDDDWHRISSTISIISQKPLFIDDTPALSPAEIMARARRVAREHGQLGLVVIDYLQLMQVPGYKENRTNEISEISRSLKMLAKEINAPVIALSQLNRGLESRPDKRPVMSDLRESGAIEQDADVIAFIYRDEVYHDDSPDKGKAEIIIGKQRNGPIGKVVLTFLGHYNRFEDYIPEQEMAMYQ